MWLRESASPAGGGGERTSGFELGGGHVRAKGVSLDLNKKRQVDKRREDSVYIENGQSNRPCIGRVMDRPGEHGQELNNDNPPKDRIAT